MKGGQSWETSHYQDGHHPHPEAWPCLPASPEGPGRLPLTVRLAYPLFSGRLPLTGRLAYPSLIGIVQPDELLTLLHDGELGLGEVRQAAPKAEKPV